MEIRLRTSFCFANIGVNSSSKALRRSSAATTLSPCSQLENTAACLSIQPWTYIRIARFMCFS